MLLSALTTAADSRPSVRPGGVVHAGLLVLLGTLLMSGSLTFGASSARAETPRQGNVHAFLSDYLDTNGLPGGAVAVVKNGEPVIETGAGDVKANTPMNIGSVSKMFTAFAVLQLVDRHRLALDDRVSRHLPEIGDLGPQATKITVRQLLSHTSGLAVSSLIAPADSLKTLIRRDGRSTAPPGTSYSYSNINYWIAARMIQVVSGQSYPRYLNTHIFQPLGMDDTHAYEVTSARTKGFDGGTVMAYGHGIPVPTDLQQFGGAGGVVSTAADLASWLQMQQHQGVSQGGTRLLSAALIDEAHRRQPQAGTYGLGWQHTSTASPARVGHDGTDTRYTARVDLVPSSGYGVVVLLNSNTVQRAEPFEISSGIIELTEGRTPTVPVPYPMIIDLVLGAVSTLALVLAAVGVRRSARWSARRSSWGPVRFGARLLPQLLFPLLASGAFVVLPAIGNNSSTAVDVFGLWPAAAILILCAAAAGIGLISSRIVWRIRHSPSGPPA